jgi:6-phosphogluconolactonase (cycloisomerase 2 family)
VAIAALLLGCGGGGGGGAAGGGGGGASPSYTIGGTVTGLSGAGLQLQNNGGDTLSLSANGNFSFPTAEKAGATYSVTILSQPVTQEVCTVGSGSGAVGSSNVTGISVSCIPMGKVVYAVASSTGNGSTFSIDPSSGALTALAGGAFATPSGNAVVVDAPSHLAYMGFELAPFTIALSTGLLTPGAGSPITGGTTNSQGAIAIDRSGHYMFVAEYSAIWIFQINTTTGVLTQQPSYVPPTGSIPSVATDPSGDFLFSCISGTTPSTVNSYSINSSTGALTELSAYTLPPNVLCSTVAVEPTGRFVYVLYGNTSVAALTINNSTGALTLVTGGTYAAGVNPAAIVFSPNGKFLYVANAGNAPNPSNVAAFTIDSVSGALSTVPGSPFASGPELSNVSIDPSGSFLYVASYLYQVSTSGLYAYRIDSSSGALTSIPGSPFMAGTGVSGVGVY